MRIKNFRMFEKSDDHFFTEEEKIDIQDICQDLKDLGFDIMVTNEIIMIYIYPQVPFTMTEDLFETIKRIEDYLDRAWFKVEVVLSGEMESREILIDKSTTPRYNKRVLFLADTGDIPHLWTRTEIKRLFIEI